MDAVLLARIQFAITIGYHFIFAPLTIGLSWFIVWFMARYWRTGDSADRDLARFWVNLFAISFAIGVPSGLAMEFQFGTNWAQYSRYVGDIFGPALAAEVLSAFFIESTFIALLLLGWNRMSRVAHWFASLMVAIAATLSAFWILASNSWMQTPAGFIMKQGHPVLHNFSAALFNYSTVPRVLHTVDAALMTGAFFVLGISAWFLLKQRHIQVARQTLVFALVVAFVTSVVQLGLGHYHAFQVAATQPTKLAAFEGLFQSQRHAPLTLFGIMDERDRHLKYAIRVPGMLSYLISFNTATLVPGLDRFPRSEWPPLSLTFYPFHLMFYIGLLLIGFTALGMILLWMRRLFTARFFLILAVLAIPLSFLANELGWMTAEIGRQPWIVYHIFRTNEAASTNVQASAVALSLGLFSLVYTLFTVVWVLAIRRELRRGPGEIEAIPSPESAA